MKYRLHRSANAKLLGGVCGGLAESFETDVTLIRIVVFLLCIFQPFIIVIYFVLMAALPVGAGDINEKYTQTHSSGSGGATNTASQNTSKEQASRTAADTARVTKRVYTKPAKREKNRESTAEEPLHSKRAASPLEDESGEPIEEKSSFVIVLFGVMLICAGIGIVIAKHVFAYEVTIAEVITFLLLSVGLFFLISGITSGGDKSKGPRVLKIIFGILILYISLSRMISLDSVAYITKDYLFYAIRYMWPVILLAIGVTLLIPNKKRGAKIWLAILIIVFVAAVVLRVGGYPLL